MENKQHVPYSAPLMATIIFAKLKEEAKQGNLKYHGRVIGYPVFTELEPVELNTAQSSVISSPPVIEPDTNTIPGLVKFIGHKAKGFIGEVKEAFKDISGQSQPEAPHRNKNYQLSFRRPNQNQVHQKEKTLYHLIERNYTLEKGEEKKHYTTRFAILSPTSNNISNEHTWNLTETFELIKDLIEANFKNQNNGKDINEYTMPHEFLIPYLACTEETKGHIKSRWLLIRIRACYNNKENKSELYIYQPFNTKHSLSNNLLKKCKQLFPNCKIARENVMNQETAEHGSDGGSWTCKNLCTILDIKEPSKDDVDAFDEQKELFFKETGAHDLAGLYKVHKPSFWVRHKAKIILASILVTTSAAVALTVFFAPQMISSPLIIAANKMSMDVGFITALSAHPAQFGLLIASAYTVAASTLISIGVLIHGLVALGAQQHKQKKFVRPRPVDLELSEAGDLEDDRNNNRKDQDDDSTKRPPVRKKVKRASPSTTKNPTPTNRDSDEQDLPPKSNPILGPKTTKKNEAKASNGSNPAQGRSSPSSKPSDGPPVAGSATTPKKLISATPAELRFYEQVTRFMNPQEKRKYFEDLGYEYKPN